MCRDKEHDDSALKIVEQHVEFDESLAFSPDSPLDPKSLPALGGVYLLSDADDRPIFLGVCENLRRVVPPRLASDEPDQQSRRAKLGEIARRISWKRTRGAFEGLLWHWQFARRHFPSRYASMLGFGPCWFLRIAPDAAFPRFEPVSVLRDGDARYFGPLPRRKDAESLIRLLEDAFDLCRYYDVLLKTPNGERCAYYDMGRCPAPCDGSAPMSTYRQSIGEAIAFLDVGDDATLTPVRRRMQTASDALAFESAAAYKRVLDAAQAIRGKTSFAHIADIDRAAWVAVIRASVKRKNVGETQIKAYGLSKGSVIESAQGRIADIASLAERWRRDADEHRRNAGEADCKRVTESLRLLSRFLFKGNSRDAVVFPLAGFPPVDALEHLVQRLADTRRRT